MHKMLLKQLKKLLINSKKSLIFETSSVLTLMKFFVLIMEKKILFFTLLFTTIIFGQTKVGGKVVDEMNEPIAYANVVLKGSKDGVITDDNGNFYFESEGNYDILIVSFVGYDKVEIKLVPGINKDLKIVLKSGISLNQVTVYTGKTSKKNNPALDILRKIWERRRKNGLKMFKHYQFDK